MNVLCRMDLALLLGWCALRFVCSHVRVPVVRPLIADATIFGLLRHAIVCCGFLGTVSYRGCSTMWRAAAAGRPWGRQTTPDETSPAKGTASISYRLVGRRTPSVVFVVVVVTFLRSSHITAVRPVATAAATSHVSHVSCACVHVCVSVAQPSPPRGVGRARGTPFLPCRACPLLSP